MGIEKLVRNNIRQLKPYSSARDEHSETEGILMDANENPFSSEVNRYPDPYQRAVKLQLAKLKSIKADQLFLGNGSDEAIDLLLRIFCEPGKSSIITTDPTYGMYEVSARINDVEAIKVPLSDAFSLESESLLAAVTPQTKMVFICSPNNPSGNLLAREEILKILRHFDGIVVVDEAYIDFTSTPSFISVLHNYPQLVILQTFSKAWGMAGVRLGMAIADKTIIDFMNKIKPPYNISVLTQNFVLSRLANMEEVEEKVKIIIVNREQLVKRLNALEIVEKIYPSDSNFLLVKFKDSRQVYDQLMAANIIVRDRSKVLHGENCLRITVGTTDENDKLIAALQEL